MRRRWDATERKRARGRAGGEEQLRTEGKGRKETYVEEVIIGD